jgi:amino acid transporter
LNAAGLVAGKIVQNVLTAAKVVGLGALVIAGLSAGPANPPATEIAEGSSASQIGLALVFVLYAYGGWNHAAFVAAEVRGQRRNLPRALMIGIAAITLVYLAVNAAYLWSLGFDGAQKTQTPAADVMQRAVGEWGGRTISVLVMLSALGAINGMILTGTRVYATWGDDYPALAWLAAWNRRSAAPIAAIVVQAIIALCLILLVGTATGRNAFDASLHAMGFEGLPWKQYSGGFDTLVAGSTPVYWALSLLTGAAVFLLRRKDRSIERPFSAPLYPLPPLMFCVTCAYMLYASAAYAKWLVLIGAFPLAIGGVLALMLRKHDAATATRIPE